MRASRRPFRRTVAAVARFLHRALVPRALPVVVVLALLAPALLAGQAQPAQAASTLGPFGCMPISDMARGTINPPSELLAGRLRIPGYPVVRIGSGPINWNADPLRTFGWRRQFYSLRWVDALTDGYRRTGNPAYLARATAIVKDFAAHVPPRSGRFAVDSWNPMYAGQRVTVLTCLESVAGRSAWLRQALAVHGAWLAANDPGDWNQGLNAAIGLLGAACRTGNVAWARLVDQRFARMAARTIDAQGAVGEQAPGYLSYLLRLWRTAESTLTTCGRRVPAQLATRTAAANDFLAWATNPAGTVEQLGDTDSTAASVPAPSPALRFALSAGAAGAAPAATTRLYSSGWVFGRSSWFPFATSMYWTQRFGAGRAYHGHHDHLSLTLWDRGAQLLADGGHVGYATNAYRTWLVGPFAHNVPVAVGAKFDRHAATRLTSFAQGAGWTSTVMTDTAFDAAPRTRSTFVDTGAHVVLVFDRAVRRSPGGWRQLWHLPVGARVTVRGRSAAVADLPATAGRPAARLHVLTPPLPGQVLGPGSLTTVSGGRGDVAGWLSPAMGRKVAAPVVVAARGQRTATFLTVLVPGAPGSVASAAVRAAGNALHVDVTINGTTTTYRLYRGVFSR
jgi:hypothetical protein